MKRIRPLLAMALALALVCLGSSFAFANDENGGGQERNGTASVDPSTMNDWATLVGVDGSSGLGANTSSIGRIWTDKTVSADSVTTSDGDVVKCDNSAFVTVLSALSGTSNVASTSTTPLDIVLVLDASGSMDDPMSDGTKRIDALQDAANDFIDEIADQNNKISDESKQHQVSIVKFAGNMTAAVGNDTYRSGGYTYNYSQVMKTMSPCNNTTKSAFTDTINAINPAGATAAEYGMQLAQGQTSNREEAKKIVIFFTDGSPNHNNGFDDSVASDAVSAAKDMKVKGETVYTVGIFDGVNPSADPAAWKTAKENKFMHAVSSNYPNATYNGWSWDFGERAEGSDYYKSASNAEELKQVFEGIFSEINKGSGYPTQTTEGAEHQSGYIAFDDKLGSYMQVDNFSAVTFSGKTFTKPQKTTEGNVDTYTFNGTVELNGKSVDLSNLVIKVTRSTNVAEGDTIQAKIPAALIPLWNFNVNRDDMTMTVSEQKPINIVYTSSLKPGVKDLLANPDETMAAYLQANSADGKVSFYNNDWNPGYLGNTTAGFEPSSNNSFYYFTKDTPIYTDEACTQRAKKIDKGTTYWYQHTYYKMKDTSSLSGAVEEATQPISFKGGDAEFVEGSIGSDDSGAYFKAGSREATFINSLYKAKDKNVTETAEDVLNPKWASVGQIASYLGNNGKLSVDLPGALAVTKQLQVPDGYSADEFASESFEFTVAVPKAANKAFNAVVKNANGEQQGDAFTLTFDGDGKAQHSLKADETLYIYGLTAGWNYTVGETERSGFDQSGTNLEGAIAAGETAQAKVVNTYKASGTLSGEQVLKGEKVFTGRNWNGTDKFTFLLDAHEGSVGVPMPEGANNGRATVEVTQPDGAPADTPVSFNFGDITYTKPGVYTYEIRESKELSVANPGVSTSEAVYEVVVTVTDEDHTGTLTVTSQVTKTYADDGKKLENPEAADVAKFVNEYNTSEVKWTPFGEKLYTDTTGSRPLEQGQFHVIVCTDDPDAPLPTQLGEQAVQAELNGKTWKGAVTEVDADGRIAFPQATYTFDDLDSATREATFEYKIVEVVQIDGAWVAVGDALNKGFDSAGINYDKTIWTATVKLKDDNGTLVLDVKYSNSDGVQGSGSSGTPMFRFSNSYNPAPVTASIKGTKTLTGRDMADGETFGFELSASDSATKEAVTAGTVTMPKDATVSGAKADKAQGFSFDKMTFAKPGEYTFNVNETAWNGQAIPEDGTNGLQFDRSVKTVKVKVTDDYSGTLKAEVVYPQGGVAFTNNYQTSTTYNGIQVEKTLTGRDMKAGEFNFVIEGKDDASKALLADDDKRFSNPNNRAEGIADVMTKIGGHTFTQADSGKSFEFTVKEVIPTGAVQDQATGLWYVEGSGVCYDGANHTVVVAVSDNGAGQLGVTTRVDGQETNVVSFANAYRAQNVSFDTANAQLKKVLQGRDWIDNDSFEFTITALDGAPMPKRDGADVSTVTLKSAGSKDGEPVSFDFGQIEFTSDVVKDAPDHKRTFTYEVTETAGTLPGIHYSDNKAVIKVTVSDNGQGKLVASATTQNGTFVNRYSAELNYKAAGGLNLAKTLTGRDMTDGQFIIKIAPNDEAAANLLDLPTEGRVVSMPAASDGVQVAVSALTGDAVITQGDARQEAYTYKVAEQGTAPGGYTYDTTERTVSITVAGDPTKGTLTATTVVSGGPEGSKTYVYSSNATGSQEAAVVPFNNSYKAAGEVGITATKSLTGRDLTEGEFNFAVKYASGGDDLLTASNKADGSIDFGKLSYTTETLAKLVTDGHAKKAVKDGKPAWTIPYNAYEKTDSLPRGVSAQTQLISFTVTVVDNGDGTLTATADTGNRLKFQNVYSTGAPVSVGLSGMKVLKSDAGLTPASIEGKFTFTVTSDDAAAPMPQKATATNDANGNVDFGDIKFTLDDLNKALGTNGTRVADADDETKGASSEEAATDAAGQSASDQGSAAGADSEEQGNAAASDGTEQGQGAAVVTGEGTGAASVSTAANKVAGAEDADQASAQSDEPATRAGVARSHTFTYKVTESGSADGVTNDTETKTVKFEVTDHGDGKLTVQRVGGDPAAAFTFTNTYSVQPVDSSVTDQVTVTKNLTGRDMKAGEFEFQLLEGTNVVATGTNDASGKVALSPITYTKPGTYNYTLCEVGGGSQKAGVQYDGSTFAVTTTVTDNGKGTLSVAHKVDNDANTVGFTNSYAPVATSVTLGASKVLNGKSLDAEEFTFVLTDEGGKQVTATNDANGMVVLPAIQYGEAGKYQYTIAEVEGDESDVTYDESKYAVTVTVEDNGEGSLVATVAYKGGNAPVFTNTYNAPEAPASPGDGPASVVEALVSGSAKTGDYLLVIAGVAAAVAAAAAAVAVVSRRKKGKHAKR